jgi:hypothetical protein
MTEYNQKSDAKSLRTENRLDVYRALGVLANNYSFLRRSLQNINMDDAEEYLKKTETERRAYDNGELKIKFYNGDFNKEQEQNFLKILKEFQKEKIQIRILGGSAYKILGGKGHTPDLDYEIIASEDGENAAKICKLEDSTATLGWLLESNKREFLFSDDSHIPYPFDNHGIRHIKQEIVDAEFTKILENENVEIFAPKRENFISEQEKVIEAYKKALIMDASQQERMQKMESRVEELKGLHNRS